MKRPSGIAIGIIFFAMFCIRIDLVADVYNAAQVRDIIGKVQGKLSELKDQGADSYAADEIARIQDHIRTSEKLLEKGEEDRAYYEIRIGVEYFNLIKARKRLLDTKAEHDKFKSDISE